MLTAQEMEAFKAEIIKEVRKEFQKMKQEIVDGKDIKNESRWKFQMIKKLLICFLVFLYSQLSERN